MSWRHLAMIVCSLAWLSACGTARHVFAAPTYDVRAPEAVKKIRVIAWAPPEEPGLGEVLSAVAADLVKLRKNYIVLGQSVSRLHWAEGCGDAHVQGVLLVRTLADKGDAQRQSLTLGLDLLRCRDGALLWRADGAATARSDDPKLVTLIANYTSTLGIAATRFAAPAFVVLQDMVEALPDPVLTDDDIAAKVELEN